MTPQKIRAILKKAGYDPVRRWRSGSDSRGRAFHRCWDGFSVTPRLRVRYTQELDRTDKEKEALANYEKALRAAGIQCWIARNEIVVVPVVTSYPRRQRNSSPVPELALG